MDKILVCLMEKGLKMEEGERLGRTIIFAKNQRHAEFVQKCFDARYSHYKGQFAVPNKMPHIAISVDMMDTGIDVHEIVKSCFLQAGVFQG